MGNEGHRILGKTLSTTRVDALELILHLTVKTYLSLFILQQFQKFVTYY